ncbi:hypothetical protein ONS96_001722 [Cadophora gregata f. sp. sojae]|nr:hypothetical protein ONS96_001722 [Cadophora gregata f. sp. sojae]
MIHFFAMISNMLTISTVLARGLAAETEMCGRYDKLIGKSLPYTFASNQWGDDGSGSQCIKIANDETTFSATWIWSNNSHLVHSFPNIKLDSNLLPLQLSSLSSLKIKASWAMAPASSSKSLEAINAAANVMIDLFLDSNPVSANSTTLPKYEIMIWLADFGGKKPIGFSSSIKNPPRYKLRNNTFTLYSGNNSNGQYVYGWLASTNITDFDEDISPLLHYLWRHKLIDDSNYLGIVQFGSEAFHAKAEVVFSAQDYKLSIAGGTPSPEPSGDVSAASLCTPDISLGIIGAVVPLLAVI